MTNDKEIVWAKLNGDWSDANYRHTVAAEGKCLNLLIKDDNMRVRNAAFQEIMLKVQRNDKN